VRNWTAEDRERVAIAAEGLTSRGVEPPEVAVVLGSGLSSFADELPGAVTIPYGEIQGFPTSGVVGHRGAAVGCVIGGRRALVLAGRVHHYEGLAVADVTFGVRLAATMGATTLVITNASGGIDPGFDVGDLMLITDQISVVGGPRRLPNPTYRMVGAYTERLQELARSTAGELGVRLRQGVYMGSLGPTYETPAEIRMAQLMGASAVGMSTVSEVQESHARGLDVLGIALITNTPIPGRFEETTHEEVLEAGRRGAGVLLSLVTGTLERL
jgi:purine-nucleoside phosphorylase